MASNATVTKTNDSYVESLYHDEKAEPPSPSTDLDMGLSDEERKRRVCHYPDI